MMQILQSLSTPGPQQGTLELDCLPRSPAMGCNPSRRALKLAVLSHWLRTVWEDRASRSTDRRCWKLSANCAPCR